MFTGLSGRLCPGCHRPTGGIDDLDRPVDRPQRQALAGWVDGAALGGAGMLNAGRSFRRIKGYKDMPVRVAALAHDAEEVCVRLSA
jgi:hypothetical protein